MGSFAIEAHLHSALGAGPEPFLWRAPVSVTLHRPPPAGPPQPAPAPAVATLATPQLPPAAPSSAHLVASASATDAVLEARRPGSPIRTGPPVPLPALATPSVVLPSLTSAVQAPSAAQVGVV